MRTPPAKPELLAPAGNLLSGVVALDCGADAVYAGLKRFNARERTENFSLEEMTRLVNYAHANNKKAYITLNTLIKESELDDVAETVAKLAEIGPDAVIVQDIGIVHLIRTYFPRLAVHASTQMGIHNSSGLRIAGEMGIRRVILERQLTFDEITLMSVHSPVEIEIFIHGALCCSLSGVCLFSSWVSGNSGNRGKCLQLCRRSFLSGHVQQKSFCLSTKDLCLIRQIPELLKLNIASFKIEGRLRKPDYITTVVSAYRLVMDADLRNQRQAVEEAEQMLGLTASRELSVGFMSQNSMKSVISPGKPGISGTFCAEIIRQTRDGLLIKPTRRIHIGDKVRAQNEQGEAGRIITIRELLCRDEKVSKVNRNQVCLLPTEEKIPRNSRLYKTGESYREPVAKLAKIPATPLFSVNLSIAINTSEIRIDVGGQRNSWTHPLAGKPAEKHALTVAAVVDMFSASDNSSLKAAEIKVGLQNNMFVPLSVLKQLRREFWKWVEKELERIDPYSQIKEGLKRFQDAYEILKNPSERPKNDVAAFALPFFCPETELSELRERIDREYDGGTRLFRIASLFQLDLLKQYPDIEIFTSFPLAVCNSLAACELRRFPAVKQVQLWPELEICELRRIMDKSPLSVELYQKGCLPLLVTRARIPETGVVKDPHSKQYRIYHNSAEGLTYVYPDQVFEIPAPPDCVLFIDHKSLEFCLTQQTSIFNLERGLE